MRSRSLIAVVVVAIGLSACASIPRGPALTYEQLLPHTQENPVWARNAAQLRAQDPVPPEQNPAPAAPR